MAADRGMKVTASARPGYAFALCIGNSRYVSSPLKNAANDAQDVAALCTSLGFSTELLLEASLDQMLLATDTFVKKLPRGGVAFFFYAGHGVQANDQNYLIPVEEVAEDSLLKYKALDVQDVLGRMERAGSNLNLVILDACRSKPTTMRGGTRSVGRGLAKIEAHAGSVIAFACEVGRTASDGAGRSGVFTANLLKHLGRPGVDVDYMLGDVAAGVKKDTNGEQLPFRNHNLQGVRPCCLLEAPPEPAAPAPAPAMHHTPSTSALASFLARCDLEDEAADEAAAALKSIGVTKQKDLALVTAEDLAELKLPAISARKLRVGLAAISGGALAVALPPLPSPPAPVQTQVSTTQLLAEAKARGNFAGLVALMRASAGDAEMQRAGCEALLDLCASDVASRVKAGAAGAIEAVVAALKAHPGDVGVQRFGFWALIYIVWSDGSLQRRAREAGAVAAVQAAAANHPGGQVAEKANEALDQIRELDPLLAAAKARGDFAGLVAVMRSNTGDAEMQIQGCVVLRELCFSDDACREKAAASGAIEAVVAALKAHLGGAAVLDWGCRALVNLTRTTSGDNQRKAGTAGAIEAVIASLKAHPGSAALQENGCTALMNMAATGDNQRKVVAAGGIEVVVAALKAYPNNAAVQERGCWMLLKCSFFDDGATLQRRARKAGAVALLETAAARHPGGLVAEKVKEVLAIIKVAEAKELGDFAGLVALMESSAGDACVQRLGCDALGVLCISDDSNRMKAGAAGAIEAVVSALKAHPGTTSVQQYGCRALLNMTINDENVIKASTAGAIETVVAALKANLGSEFVQEFGCRALMSMTRDEDGAWKCGKAGAIEAAIAALKAHPENAAVQEHGCWVLLKCSLFHGSLRRRAREAGALAVLEAAAANHPGGKVAEKATDALAKIREQPAPTSTPHPPPLPPSPSLALTPPTAPSPTPASGGCCVLS